MANMNTVQKHRHRWVVYGFAGARKVEALPNYSTQFVRGWWCPECDETRPFTFGRR